MSEKACCGLALSKALENIIIGTLVDFPECCQLTDADIVIASLDVGIEIP